MHVNAALAILAASCPLALAAPAESVPAGRTSLRLVKTSEKDPGQWVDEKDFWNKFISKNINFVDITDIEVSDMCAEHLRLPGADILPGQGSPRDPVWADGIDVSGQHCRDVPGRTAACRRGQQAHFAVQHEWASELAEDLD